MTDLPALDLAPALRALLAFRDARDWQQFHKPKDLAAALAIEAGELQELFLWRAAETGPEVAADGERLARVREEVADCAMYLLLLAHEVGIDLPDAIADKLRANAARYPVEEHRGVARKAPRLQEPESRESIPLSTRIDVRDLPRILAESTDSAAFRGGAPTTDPRTERNESRDPASQEPEPRESIPLSTRPRTGSKCVP